MIAIHALKQDQPHALIYSNTIRWLLIGAIIAVIVIHFALLTVYPSVFIDEGWIANTSWSWLQTGVNFDLIHAGVLDQFGYEWVTDNFLGQLPYVLVYQLLGVGLFQTRLVAWIFSLVLLYATVQVGRYLYHLNVGLLAALLLALSNPFLESSRLRQDIVLAAMIMISFWLALYALRHNKLWAHFLSGLLLGLGFDVHQTSIIFIPALASLYLLTYGWRLILKPGTWLVGIGGAVGLGYYVITHILPSYEVYSRLMSFYFTSGAEAQIPITNPSLILESAVRELARYRFRNDPVSLGMIVLGGLILLLRRTKADLLLIVYTGVAFTSFILLSNNKTPLYAINLYPFFMLLVAAGFVALAQMSQPRYLARLAAAALVLFMGYNIVQVAGHINGNIGYNYQAITDQIREVIPPDQRVLGMPTWWLGMTEYDYRSSLSIPYYRFFNDYNVQQALEAIRPDYIIVDSTQQVVLVDPGQILPQGMNSFSVPRAEFQEFLQTQGELVLEFTDPWHGNFQIYRVNWAE
jgi:4-amino-4-deoxy-L-arabinose transferase-like glycosyltransferase